ncbi:MAG: hypothetical protein RRA94_14800, partial [Bacteroidota bacterium]|nr:hypothetical protein [Bacteroidota bacterium]
MSARFATLLLVLLLAASIGQAQQRHWVFFSDRGTEVETRLARMLAEQQLSGEALQRRGGAPLAGDLAPHP